ncbi:MAG: DUF2177 family protein [Alphaproteobacteria bacterium]|nr:DUF2177 family protein [Alphaproteobacteria bacterium]
MTAGLVAFVLTLVAFGVIDAVWLKAMAQRAYAAEIGALLRDKPRFIPALLFYLMFAAGLAIFAVNPGIAAKSPPAAIASGALLGLVAYGTYNLTNLAVIRGYSARIATIDLLWGVVASASTAGIVTWIGMKLIA